MWDLGYRQGYLEWLCSNRGLPVSLVTEDRSKVSNKVDDSENKTTWEEDIQVL